jgi:hypothetical protein
LTDLAPGRELPVSRLLMGTRLDPRGSTGFSILVIFMVLLVGVSAALASFEGQMAVAEWAMLQGPRAVVVPIVIDGSIVVFSLAAILKRSRGQSTFLSWTFVGVFTAISIAANALHVLIEAPNADQTMIFKSVGGAFVAGVMPISIWLVTHILTDLLVEKPSLSREDLRAQIAQEIEDENAGRIRAAELARTDKIERSKRAEDQRRSENLAAEWERIKDAPESSMNGTPEREAFVAHVRATYEECGKNASRTAESLGVTYPRVRSALDFDTSQ